MAHDLTVLTENGKPFEGLGVAFADLVTAMGEQLTCPGKLKLRWKGGGYDVWY